MNISPTITLNANDGELGELMALCLLAKDVVTFESEVKVLDRLEEIFAKGSAIRALNLPFDDFLLLAESVDKVVETKANLSDNPTVKALNEFLFLHDTLN